VGRRGGQHERHAAVGIGDARDPGGGIGDHWIVERVDLGKHVEGVERRDGLALGGSHVGLQRVTEAAIGIAIGAERVEDGLDRRATQEASRSVPVEQTGVGEQEPLGGNEIDGHAAECASASMSQPALRAPAR